MTYKRQIPERLLLTTVLLIALPMTLGAQQHHHHRGQDTTGMHLGHMADTTMMGDSVHAGTWMEMLAMMSGGHNLMGMPMGSLMERVMRFQPASVLPHADALDLTNDQVSQFETLVSEQETVHQEYMQSMFEDTQSLVELFDSDDVDIEEIRALAEGAMRPFRALQWRAITDARKVRDLLTSTQREKLNSLPVHGHMMNDQGDTSRPHTRHQHHR